MPEIMLLSIIHQAMDQHGADGLWNGNGPCGCGRGDLAPCGGLQTDCVLAKSGTVREGEDDENNAVGDTVWYPMQAPRMVEMHKDNNGFLSFRPREPSPRHPEESIPQVDLAGASPAQVQRVDGQTFSEINP